MNPILFSQKSLKLRNILFGHFAESYIVVKEIPSSFDDNYQRFKQFNLEKFDVLLKQFENENNLTQIEKHKLYNQLLKRANEYLQDFIHIEFDWQNDPGKKKSDLVQNKTDLAHDITLYLDSEIKRVEGEVQSPNHKAGLLKKQIERRKEVISHLNDPAKSIDNFLFQFTNVNDINGAISLFDFEYLQLTFENCELNNKEKIEYLKKALLAVKLTEGTDDYNLDFEKKCNILLAHLMENEGTPQHPTTRDKSENEFQEKEKIKLELNQTQIVYLFQCLIEQNCIKENQNPKLWHLVSQYFTDSEGQPLKNIHQLKDKLKNSKTGKPKHKAELIEKVAKNAKKG